LVDFVINSPEAAGPDNRGVVFLSASIPDPDRWTGDFSPFEITDAVVAFARVFLSEGYRIVTAAHPTVAPLLLYVAAEMPLSPDRIIVYQSQLFEDVLPTATRRFEADGVGSIVWTPAAPDDSPEPGNWDRSLQIMRNQMLEETRPAAACFIGGMGGIPDERDLFAQRFPEHPIYPAGRPGGAARILADELDQPIGDALRNLDVYPALWRRVVADIGSSALGNT
jgi:hypothetical protein